MKRSRGLDLPSRSRLENKRERELQLSAGCSLRTGKGLHQYKIIVKEVSKLKEDRDILQQVVFTHIGFPPYILCSLV